MQAGDYILSKVGRVLAVILFCMVAVLVRVWYLAVVQHDKHVEEAHKPQRRTAIEHMGRASIRDRFNQPLALNKVHYQAAVCYSYLRDVPSIRWEKDASGKKVRVQARLKHIKELSKIMGDILHIDPVTIEDVIHAKAALVPHTPFVIKEGLSESEYYRLRALEKDWPGLVVQRTSLRFYPRGKVGCDVLGSMGAISAAEYEKFVSELAELEEYVVQREAGENPFLPKGFSSPYEVRQRLLELQERAYTICDFVGRTGIEAAFDEKLRGYSGRKVYEVDVKGNYLRELPGSRPPLPGQRLLLTISAELQEYAEQLLGESETWRIQRGSRLEKEPWIKGGAIVAIDAATGEILALASHPRFDPNDFISHKEGASHKQAAVRKWLESEAHIGEIWDGKAPLDRELYGEDGYYSEEQSLTWKRYLDAILPSGPMLEALSNMDIRGAIDLQRSALQPDHPIFNAASHPTEKLLMIDLCHLVAQKEAMPPSLVGAIGSMSLSQLFLERHAFLCLEEEVRKKTQQLFIENDFAKWREKHFKTFLKAKRKEEKAQGRYAKPYTEYLEQFQKKGFSEFWKQFRMPLMLSLFHDRPLSYESELYWREIKPLYEKAIAKHENLQSLAGTVQKLSGRDGQFYLRCMRPFKELNKPLLARYPRMRNEKGQQLGRHLAAAFYPVEGYSYARSQAFRQSSPAGSVFKMFIAYQALMEKYQKCAAMQSRICDLNPLTLTDYSPQQRKVRDHDTVFGRTSEGRPITRLYKGGRLPRSSHAGIGEVDLLGAIEQSSNIYFSILAAEEIDSPAHLVDSVHQFGYGEKTGIELPGEFPGNLPDDIDTDKSALYSFAIGQHTLLVTPLQTALALGALAGDGHLLKPSIVQVIAGKERVLEDEELFYRTQFPYREEFAAVGVHFPLFTALAAHDPKVAFTFSPVQIRRSIFLPKEIRETLLEGMRRVVTGSRGSARPSAVRPFCLSPSMYQDYLAYSHRIAGKTGTAEIMYKPTIDVSSQAAMTKHTWFAVASYPNDAHGNVDWDHPELIVAVYLRFALAGREAAPLAIAIMKKWAELKTKYGASSHIASH